MFSSSRSEVSPPYSRRKLAYRNTAAVRPALVRFGSELAAVLERRPRTGPLFPYLSRVRPGDRATEFKQSCQSAGVQGATLHSYRYGWAERAAACGYPERFAQQALGHNSKAVHRAYAKNADVIVPSLDDWETHWRTTQQPPPKPELKMPNPPPQPGPAPTPESPQAPQRPGDGLPPA
jgi:integrase